MSEPQAGPQSHRPQSHRPQSGGPDEGAAEEEWVETPEERTKRSTQADADVRALMRSAVLLGAGSVGVAALAAAWGITGARALAEGLAIGGLVAILNLRVLARAIWALVADKDLSRALLGFGASLALVAGSAAYVAFAHAPLALGFALGLALPAPAGIWFGLRLQRYAG